MGEPSAFLAGLHDEGPVGSGSRGKGCLDRLRDRFDGVAAKKPQHGERSQGC